MNSLFQNPKRSCRRALGTLLLALPLSGIVLQLPPAQAQPAVPLPAKKSPKPLSPEQKAAIAKAMAISQQQALCKIVIDLKVENATLQDVTARVKALLPGRDSPIEVRGANPARVSFDLKATRVGDVLGHVAALAGCKLFLLSSGLLLAPSSQLTQAEQQQVKQRQGGEWMQTLEAGRQNWSIGDVVDPLLARAIAQEVTGSDVQPFPAVVVKTTFSNFSPDSQQMLQTLINSSREESHQSNPLLLPLHLDPSSPISVDTSKAGWVSIGFKSGPSDLIESGTMMGISIR